MYSLKPIVTEFEVEKAESMYAMRDTNPPESLADSFLAKLERSINIDRESDLNELEAKQKLLLEKLKELRRQLTLLQNELPICRKPFQLPARAPFPPDLVISVDPAAIPYSLLLLLKKRATGLAFFVDFYTHSTVSELPEEARKFADEILRLGACYGVRVTVIWKTGMPSTFQVTVGSAGSFWGEDNFIRYLTRLGVLEKPSEADDGVLDLAHQLLALDEDKRELSKAADRLLVALKKQKPSRTADFAIYSALRNFRNATKIAKVDAALKEIEGRL
ncbi:probable aminoacyl tRNA synthase complex-interacting multifunctional protein 2 [Phlebotomus argentipes]|uniref:probable aminoacyl tRNA synthase complex-interacting multifunctional protein 2 n=1 Tax=Phlebotomus argentipes TaxID=94469 RepID=UPI002892EEB0|nr:probable aminoacyl tRNA synthase complex-interacting multifunctional protein 2 [Phlebotomus argentipes]